MTKMIWFLRLSQPVITEAGDLVQCVGPFEKEFDAKMWWSNNNKRLDELGVERLTLEAMHTVDKI